ncbi:4Fe-4S binding protein [Syntrophaceticus schinkii]|jgi:pyruvate ferredoxin oxidoreductase delta subunit|nr:4Fe-4S binding protein [Syntrophaceticus schinkii]
MDIKWISPLGDGGLYVLNTGKWRTFRPVIDKEKCTDCATCAHYCPVQAMRKDLKDKDSRLYIDLSYCKGCGICEVECPRKAITMVREEVM